MWTFAVKSVDGEVHESRGSNIIPGFPEGTGLESWGVNGHFVKSHPDHRIATGKDFVIPFAVARELRDLMRKVAAGPKPAA